jgi:hypothetical protein
MPAGHIAIAHDRAIGSATLPLQRHQKRSALELGAAVESAPSADKIEDETAHTKG